MHQMDQKKLLATRIIAYLDPVPENAVQTLLGKSVGELEVLLDKMMANRAKHDAEDTVEAHAEEMHRESAFEAAYVSALRNVTLNGKRLTDSEATRNMLESLLNPGEVPTGAGYATLAKQFSNRFSWEFPPAVKTAADQEAEFVRVCHENLLSLCDANRQMHRDGVALENWAGCSGLERAAFQAEAQAARQKWLINSASPSELKAESAYESQKNREEFQRAEADRQHQVSLQQQSASGLFPPLPVTHAETGEIIDARWLRKTSTINFELFKRLCKRHGSAAVTSRLRGEM